jgi:hypothetical protein
MTLVECTGVKLGSQSHSHAQLIKQTDRWANEPTNRQIDTQRDIQIDRQTNGQVNLQTGG